MRIYVISRTNRAAACQTIKKSCQRSYLIVTVQTANGTNEAVYNNYVAEHCMMRTRN
jgi:hypothetical protein